MKSKLFYILILIVITFGCGKDAVDTKRSVPVLNIIDAESLVILGSDLKSGNTEEKNLYKITSDGSLEEVKFVNSDGSELDEGATQASIKVEEIFKMNDAYICLVGNFTVWDTLDNFQYYNTLLVRKDDGAIFDFGNEDDSYSELINAKFLTKHDENLFQTDQGGNLYYPNGNGSMIYKLDISDPNSLIRTEYLPSGQKARYFAIDKDGNCIYHLYSDETLRVKKQDGGIFDINMEDVDFGDFWIGNSGEIYFTSHNYWQENDAVGTILISKLDNSNGLDIVTVWQHISDYNYETKYMGVVNYDEYFFKIKKQNSIIFINAIFSANDRYHWEFFENNNTVTPFELPNIKNNPIIISSPQYYYIASGTDLLKISLENHAYQNLLTPGEYEVYSMTVSNDDIIQFSGMRFLDGKKIFGEINANGSLTILDEEKDKIGIVLQRLD
jgi:hypothetical protein